jgi:hypothetical protein
MDINIAAKYDYPCHRDHDHDHKSLYNVAQSMHSYLYAIIDVLQSFDEIFYIAIARVDGRAQI